MKPSDIDSLLPGPKGNLRFPHDKPLPLALIARIVRHKVKQDAAKASVRKKK